MPVSRAPTDDIRKSFSRHFAYQILCDVAGRAQTLAVLCEGLGVLDENILLKALDFIFKGRLVELCFISRH